MTPFLLTAADWLQGVIFIYFLAINATYTLLIIFALREIVRYSYLSTTHTTRRLLGGEFFKPVSVLVPAHNESAVISQSVRSLLNLHYPEFEIVVINDGSTDGTMAVLTRDFDLKPTNKPVRLRVPHAPVKAIYVSAAYSNLIVVDKENGGKADAINAGINVSAYPLFCSIDADSLLEPDAILKASRMFVEDDEVIATGGIVRVLNGCTVRDGSVMEIGMPGGTLEAIQVLEYTRAFLSGRTGWNMVKSLLIISGAFGVFRKDMVVAVNGYRKTVGEDMDLVMRLHRHCRDHGIPYKVLFVPDPVCWTQVPSSLDMLRKQRNRWHRGLIDSLITNRSLILNPKYGAVSLIGTSYFLFVEVLGPIVELCGYISIPILYAAGLLGTKFMLLLITIAVLWGISINIAAVFLDSYNYRRYRKTSDILRLCLLSIVEFFGYRQITLYERVKACFSFRSTHWGTQARSDMHAVRQEKTVYAKALEYAQGSGVAIAASRFVNKLPALLLAMMALRAAELAGGMPPGTAPRAALRLLRSALACDLLTLVRFLPPLFLLSLPFLMARNRRVNVWGINALWTLLLLAQAALVQYFLTARVPLGSDLLAYTFADIVTTARGGLTIKPAMAIGALLGLAAFWGALEVQRRRWRPLLPPLPSAILIAASLAAAPLLPSRPAPSPAAEDAYNLALNKSDFFYTECAGYIARERLGLGSAAARTGGAGYGALDPAYPFMRREDTPDSLGEKFNIKAGSPPNLVFIIIEGMGRAFTGPGAELGSFTPSLDRLAERGLYWDNFLANQGRTFGVLPSVFASLPFGANGFTELGANMPPHVSLLSVLKRSGYRLNAYCGFDMDFDNDSLFYRRQGVDRLVDEKNFGPGYPKANVWGYADKEVFARALADEARMPAPFVSVLNTETMHTPYTFPGQDAYTARFEQRLTELGIAEKDKAAYRAYRNIYTTILYTDDAIAGFIEGYSKLPAYANTIFIITADHRLPELPMSTRLDRYHVPLLIFSPLLKAPERIRSVSSHLDITPSLLAFLSHNYGITTPETVTWLGDGLDLEPAFRNVHDIPIMQTKTDLVDYVSGTHFLSKDVLYDFIEGMNIEPSRDQTALADLRARFSAFLAANRSFTASLKLMPQGAENRLAGYKAADRRGAGPAPASAGGGLSVTGVNVPASAGAGGLEAEVTFTNGGLAATGNFVPLGIISTAGGEEVSETYGAALSLAPGRSSSVKLHVKTSGIAPGRYFLSVFPSAPADGKKTGKGRYRLPVQFR